MSDRYVADLTAQLEVRHGRVPDVAYKADSPLASRDRIDRANIEHNLIRHLVLDAIGLLT